jgi:hypothetical protein
MGHTGRLKYVNATKRIGLQGGKSWVISPDIDSPSVTLTAANRNTATLFFAYAAGEANATSIRATSVPLTAGQSFTFTGVPIGNLGYRNVSFASGNPLYLTAVSTPQMAVFGYYIQA